MRGVKWCVAGLLLVLAGGAALAWWQREPLQIWWVVRGLRQAPESDRPTWLSRLDSLGSAAIPSLMDALADEATDAGPLAGLDHLAHAGHAGPLVEQISRGFSRFSSPTQARLLGHVATWCDASAATPEFNACCTRLLGAAVDGDTEVLAAGLTLAGRLMQQAGDATTLTAVRELTGAALRCSQAETRLQAVRVALQPGLEMLEQVVGLLRDSSAEVRRAAILAVGPAEQLVREDVLLPGLHDTDPEVRRLTEVALRGRGLRPEHLELGRLLTHPQPTTRLEVLDRIRDMLDDQQSSDLDPGVWLRRLSHDHSPAVRAAALRLMSQQSVIDLTDRMDQMARSDPSPTVSQLAAYYRRGKAAPAPER
ncbi:MAG: hypothetical protein U0840_03320 [Gemmataceae bacterium]